MRAFCTVHYTGEATAEMHTRYDLAADRGGGAHPSAFAAQGGRVSPADAPHGGRISPASPIPEGRPPRELAPLAGLQPPKRGAVPLPSSKQRPSGAGRVTVLQPGGVLQVAPMARSSGSPRAAHQAGARGHVLPPALVRVDTGLRPTSMVASTSLPAL